MSLAPHPDDQANHASSFFFFFLKEMFSFFPNPPPLRGKKAQIAPDPISGRGLTGRPYLPPTPGKKFWGRGGPPQNLK